MQAFPFDCSVDDLNVDLLSASAHKLYGPTGIGALYVRSGTTHQSTMFGGGQERDNRAGTENVAGIVGFAVAVDWCRENTGLMKGRSMSRDMFGDVLLEAGFVSTVDFRVKRILPGHFHCRYPGIEAEPFLMRLDREGLSASSGAACSSGSLESSHVLLACGFTIQEAKEGLRFSFGADTTEATSIEAAGLVVKTLQSVLSVRGGTA